METPDSKEAARKRNLRRMLFSLTIMVIAVAAGVWSFTRDETAVLIVTSRPEGAEVVLNYRPTNVLSNAFMAGLPADRFIVTVRLDGYRPVPPEQVIRLFPNDTTRITFLMSPRGLEDDREMPTVEGRPYPWQWRHVRMNSNPPGAEVVVNDVPTGLYTPSDFLFDEGVFHLQAHWPNGAKAFKNLTVKPSISTSDVNFISVTYVQPEKDNQ